jgi:hypothetical protein
LSAFNLYSPQPRSPTSSAARCPPGPPGPTAPRVGLSLHSRGVSDWLHVRPELDLWVALTPLPGGVRLVTRATRTRLMRCTHSTPGGCQIGYTCDQNSTYALPLTPGGCQIGYMCDQNSTYGLHSLHSRGVSVGYTCDQNSTYGLHSLLEGVRLVTWTPGCVIHWSFDCRITWIRVPGLSVTPGGVSDWLHALPGVSSVGVLTAKLTR